MQSACCRLLFANCSLATMLALMQAMASLGIRDKLSSSDDVSIAGDGDSLQNWLKSFSTLQGASATASPDALLPSATREHGGPALPHRHCSPVC